MPAMKNVVGGGAATPDSADDADQTNHYERTDSMLHSTTTNLVVTTATIMLDYFQALGRLADLDPLECEFLDHCGWMIAELEAAAVEAGRLPEMWRALQLWTETDVEYIRGQIIAERADLAELDIDDPLEPVPHQLTDKALAVIGGVQ